uniref:Leucine rich repeat (in FLII) interacting protein 1a n=1 Tax=Denticeps clupeoides TaxID=299321 RepID=A0AAY4B711_9TELE
MSVGSRTSIRSDLDRAGVYGGASEGGSVSYSHKKSKKKKKKHKDRNGYDDLDDYSTFSSLSSRISDESRASRSSRPDLQQPGSYSDLYSSSSLPASRQPSASYNTSFQGSLYEDCTSSVPTRYSSSSTRGPSEYRSVLSSRSRTSSRASSACGSPADDDCSSVASFLRSAASSSGLLRDLDHVTIPDLYADDRLDRDYPEKGTSRASSLSTATLASLGGTSSRRGSADTAITADAEASIREIKDAMVEVEDKYRKAMVSNAQLDNEKSNLMYQVDVLKDSLMELEELLSETRRECEDKTKELEREKHAHGILQFQFNELKETLKQSEELLNEIRQLRLKQDCFVREIADLQETVDWKNKKIGALERQKEYSDAIRNERDELRDEVVQLKDILKVQLRPLKGFTISTISRNSFTVLMNISAHIISGSSLAEIRLRKLVDERENLIEHVKRLKGQLEKKNQKNSMDEASSPDGEIMENGSDPNIMDVQRDASRQINDLKFKLVKSEQDVTALEQNVTRLEGQVTRYKSASENAEKIEDELKAEKRKLQRELRAALDKIEELEASNSHLSKRMEKMKSGRSTAQTPL